MNMILKKRHIVLAALVLALGVAVYLNWAFSDAAKDFAVSGTGGDAGGKKYGDAQLVNGDGEDGAADADGYFSEARISRQKARDEAVATIQKVFADVEVDEEQRAAMTSKANQIATDIETEGKIENLIKAKGFEDCMVYISEDSADVMVKTDGLLANEAAVIKDIIIQTTDIPVENVKILEVN